MEIPQIFRLVTLINICACTLLVLFGFCSNALSLMVFWHSKHKTPKIGARDYLTILTIVNSIFLVAYWYNMTGPLILSYFELDSSHLVSRFFNFKDKSSLVCKLANYVQQASRCLSTLLTLAFTLERTIAIYFPFKLRHYKQNVNFLSITILCGLIFISVLVSIDSFVFYKAIEVYIEADPSITSLCHIANQHQTTHNKITYFVAIFTLVLPFIFIILSNIAIVVRLRQAKKTLHSGISRGSAKSNVALFSARPNATLRISTAPLILDQSQLKTNNNIARPSLALLVTANEITTSPRLFRPSLNSQTSASLSYLNLQESSLSGSVPATTTKNIISTGSTRVCAVPASSKGEFWCETISSEHNSELCSACSFQTRVAHEAKPNQVPVVEKKDKKRVESVFSLFRTNRIKKSSANRPIHIVMYKSKRASACSSSLNTRNKQDERPRLGLFEINSNEQEQVQVSGNTNWMSCTNGCMCENGGKKMSKRRLSLQRRFSMDNMSLMRIKSRSEQDFVWHCANKKMHSTKVLVVLTSFYIVLNIPHFVDIFLSHNMALAQAHEVGDEVNPTRYLYQIFLLVGGIFYLSNFSVSGLLLFASGKIYRRHLYGLTVKLARPFQKFKSFLVSKFKN
jgi:hypothetical protein